MIYWKVRSTGRKSEQYREAKLSATTNVVVAVVNDAADEEPFTSFTNSSSESGNSTAIARRPWEFLRTILTFQKKSCATRAALRSASREYQQERAVAIQASLYVSACLTSVVGIVAMALQDSARVQREHESDIYWLIVLVCITVPLQGFLNLLIYIRPRYLRWRRVFPTRSRLCAVWQCLTNQIPPIEARMALRIESQIPGCNEPGNLASDSLADLQTDPAVCAGDNSEDVMSPVGGILGKSRKAGTNSTQIRRPLEARRDEGTENDLWLISTVPTAFEDSRSRGRHGNPCCYVA
ncbi:hypothetical protein MHU86_21076 [Fragilaria crotonensis]|nr:hypothetical protein MHU86_21076 [Fragilaria crotonensis]